MRGVPLSWVVLVFVTLCDGCSDTFSPDGPYKEKLVVFGVLSTRSDTQYVYVRTTYRSPENSGSTHVEGAQVIIHEADSTFLFRDTALTINPAATEYAHVAYRLHVQPGLTYTLSVSSPSHGSVASHGTGLYRGTLVPEPDLSGDLAARVYPGVNARAFIVRLYLEYEVLEDTSWIPMRAEIPVSVHESGELVYPKPVSRDVSRVAFGIPGYASVVTQLRQRYPNGRVRLDGTAFVLTQLDDALFAYYSTVNGFPGSGTLRLDEPDYTNIAGGVGIFAMSSETTVRADTAGQPLTR